VPQTIAVIIPYYQREPGILNRALASVQRQQIPDGWLVEVIVVDDGSPCPAKNETRNITFDRRVHLTVVTQENCGVAAARNRGLDEVSKDTSLIAFLDSDDIWLPHHLERAIRALATGSDFYFTDRRRAGHYESYIRECALTGKYIATCRTIDGFVVIPPDRLLGLIIKEFAAATPTVVYRRSMAPKLRFNVKFKSAGEDLVFLCMLVATARSVVFDPGSRVERGTGLNIYLANYFWDSPKRLAILVDQLIAHRLVGQIVKLSSKARKWNDAEIKYYRRELGFDTVRSLIKFPARVPKPIMELIKRDALVAMTLPLDILMGAVILLRGKL
jgi:succinoglycan biosynthesis protein ExoW